MKRSWIIFLSGLGAGVLILILGGKAVSVTSGNEFCSSCHIHPDATSSWKQSVHYITRSGNITDCVDCHLPPRGEGYLVAKAETGIRDLWGKLFKDPASFDWVSRSRLENARHYIPERSCTHCHKTLFTPGLSKKGDEAHLYYDRTEKGGDLHCINCHLNAGHYIEGYKQGGDKDFGKVSSLPGEIFTEPAKVEDFSSFTEYIPHSPVSFRMVAVPGGEFLIGSPDDEPFRDADEGPRGKVELSPFFMGEVEVTWDEYLAFYARTSAEGRSSDTEVLGKQGDFDAITGATPPYGQPDQGWGKGSRPVISISFHAAETYTRWLSQVTGKTYRLPTEAEWEYACRGGTTTPYFFPGDPRSFQREGFLSGIRKNDTVNIASYAIYGMNSSDRTQTPDIVRPNPFGLRNMSGNVAEFCSDWYSPAAYSAYQKGSARDPGGPPSGEEHVIRGGSFRDEAGKLRSADRDHTRSTEWLRTDPQIPKSIWWYSDCFHVGFRVVCEYDEKTGNSN